MPKPRKPAKVLAASGTFNQNPARAIGRAPVDPGAPIGEPPIDLPEAVQTAWREIVGASAPGVLTSADFIAVRSAARLLALENEGSIQTTERRQMHDLLTAFGMTPRGRNYVTATPPKRENPFSTL